MTLPSLPSSIQDYTIDYDLSAEQNLERYFKQRLREGRMYRRGKVLVTLDELYEGYAQLAGLGFCALVLGLMQCYEQLVWHNHWSRSWPLFSLGVAGVIFGCVLFWYTYSKFKTDRRLKKHIKKGALYKQVHTFFEQRWLAMRGKPLLEDIEKGIKHAQTLHKSYWIELTEQEEHHGNNIPMAVMAQLQEKKRLQQVTQEFYKLLKQSTYGVITHQLQHAPRLNQEKEFYFSHLERLEGVQQAFNHVQTSAEAEAVLQQLLDERKRSTL